MGIQVNSFLTIGLFTSHEVSKKELEDDLVNETLDGVSNEMTFKLPSIH